MLVNGCQIVLCVNNDEFGEVFMDCLVDTMSDRPLTPGCIIIPTNLNLRYSSEGGLGLAIGRYFIMIPSFIQPIKKDEVVREIGEAYEFLFSTVFERLKLGDIHETVIVPEQEYGLEIEIRQIQ
jgi:hypothetical protein